MTYPDTFEELDATGGMVEPEGMPATLEAFAECRQ